MTASRSDRRRAFPAIRLARSSLATFCCVAGNLLPARAAIVPWSWALRLDRHQEVAAVGRAKALLARRDARAWEAFRVLLDGIENRRRTSASDLHLARLPGRLVRRWLVRLLWGPATPPDDGFRDRNLRRACAELAREHCRRSLAAGELGRAARAVRAWTSLAGVTAEVRQAAAELAWRRDPSLDDPARLRAALEPILEDRAWASPFDAIAWAARLLDRAPDLAEKCLRQARAYLPEVARVWTLSAAAAWRRREPDRAALFCERALGRDPQDLDAALLELEMRGSERLEPLPTNAGRLEVEMPATLEVGATAAATCRLRGIEAAGASADWSLRVLPPAGWGLQPEPAETAFDDAGRAVVQVAARRPDRVCGGPWPLVFLAAGPGGYLTARREVSAPDREPGRLLVTITEDHEIHEERGAMPVDQLRRLLVEKSRFAADRGVPWTHMVETGSSLALLRWAAERYGGSWSDLERDVRRHLAEEVRRGNDVQPHLHAFNDPRCGRFPYRIDGDLLETPLEFLLTSAERRGDWASECLPPGRAATGRAATGRAATGRAATGRAATGRAATGRAASFDRLASVACSVADLEEVGFAGSPDYRAVLWRSGLLDYGVSPDDRAWSAVALRRAGLAAVSDVAKPSSPWGGAVPPAFPSGWRDPADPRPGGPLVQLPIVANLEGDYLMGPGLLRRRARKCTTAVRRDDGSVRPGVHLFTLITHDKFLNARRGRDEFRLDPDDGDWPTIRRHVAAWREAGARFVTARDGVEAVLDDLAWHPIPQLRGARFRPAEGGGEARFRLEVLGRGIPASNAFPQHLRVPVPCFLRRHVETVRVERAGLTGAPESAAPEVEYLAGEPAAFWIRRCDDHEITVRFLLAATFSPPEIPPPAESGE